MKSRKTRLQIKDAVILMAGTGSRLRVNGATLAKPLIPVLGRPLISHTLEALARAGIENVYAVVGFESEFVMEKTRPLVPRKLHVEFIKNADWIKQNGLSVLAAARHVRFPFLLTMSDHLYDDAVIDVLLCQALSDKINLAVDRKIDSIFDLDDAMKVQTRGDRIVAIGKSLAQYDAIDTGVFVCGPEIFDYLEEAKRDGDCSLAEGVRLAAVDGKARAVDIEQAWWQDVDTPEMLAQAEEKLRTRSGRGNSGQSQASAGDREPQMQNPLRQTDQREN
jgi:1L-myo-inositol 1-phosphate cytidylyltransferase